MLNPTDLVHEAYLKLGDGNVDWRDRLEFYTIAGRVMREILSDDARRRRRQKRGGNATRLPLEDVKLTGPEPFRAADVDIALERLGSRQPRKAHIVKLMYFEGLTYEEVASALNISTSTVHRELHFARAWLQREL
jgi:RNA polymerase sigma factor (TIGR02999 family)